MQIVTLTPAKLALFAERRIFHALGAGERWRAGERIGLDKGCALEPYSLISAGHVLPQALGAFSYTHSALPPLTRVGRYSSIGKGLSFMGDAHPAHWVSTSPFSYDRPDGTLRFTGAWLADQGVADFAPHAFDPTPAPVHFGHDVWVGDQAMFKGGVSVGDGAVVGARALVTRDVPPYAVVAGAPARVIRMRFPEAAVARLLAVQWWRFGPDVVQRLDVRDVEAFLQAVEALDAPPAALTPLTYVEIGAAG